MNISKGNFSAKIGERDSEILKSPTTYSYIHIHTWKAMNK